MERLTGFMRRERLYVLLAIFVLSVNLITVLPSGTKSKDRHGRAGIEARSQEADILLKRDQVEKILSEKKTLALLFSLTSLLILAVLFLGIIIDFILFSLRLSKKTIDIRTYKPALAAWNLVDVGRVVVLFLFFGYIMVIIESLVASLFPIIKNDNFRMILNSSVLDILATVFILYFTVGQYKEKIVTLGLSFKNFLKNVFYGIIGYLAMVPVLLFMLILTAIVTNLVKYIPEKQPVVELFLKEKDAAFLFYTSIFTAIVGPFIEELFFRGFLYNAAKKYMGIFWAMLGTAAAFATLHTNITGFFPILVIGLVMTYLYEKTGTLVSPITLHVIHNLSMVFLVFLIKGVKV